MILDLFAGPGGWSEGLRLLGALPDLGLEHDDDACATRYDAGHATWQTDVATVSPRAFLGCDVEGIIASPPCQAFSASGKREGAKDLRRLRNHVISCGRQGWHDPGDDWADPRSELILEPLRWVDTLWPSWLALEQVPPALPLWRALEVVLTDWGYQVWSGVLEAADYGLPQTRQRAFLLASLDAKPQPPTPTHTSAATGTLFGRLEPWRTMGQALGWDAGRVGFARVDDLGTSADGYRERDWRPVSEPAFALTEKARSWVFERPATTVQGDPRVWAPGHKVNEADRRRLGVEAADARYGDRAGSDAIRVTLEQALTLQGFRPDYPVAGSRTSAFGQVGDAVPPPLAAAVLEQLVCAKVSGK